MAGLFLASPASADFKGNIGDGFNNVDFTYNVNCGGGNNRCVRVTFTRSTANNCYIAYRVAGTVPFSFAPNPTPTGVAGTPTGDPAPGKAFRWTFVFGPLPPATNYNYRLYRTSGDDSHSPDATFFATPPNQVPSINLQNPAADTTFWGFQNVTVSGSASDPDGLSDVDRIEVYDHIGDVVRVLRPGIDVITNWSVVLPLDPDTCTECRFAASIFDKQGVSATDSVQVISAWPTLRVNNGTGDGLYDPGETATITATVPAGQRFNGWQINEQPAGFSFNTAISPSSFSMPAGEVTVTATFVDNVLTVINGTGGGNYSPGQTPTITANAPPVNQAFDKWTGNTAALANPNAPSTTVTMPASNVTVTATYKVVSFNLTVNNGAGDGAYLPGATPTITADAPPAGQVFNGWTSSHPDNIANAAATPTTFTMPSADASVTATYANVYALTVVNGTLSSGGTGGNFKANQVVGLVANAVPAGQFFAGWTATGGTLATPNALTTNFTMPAAAATATANYQVNRAPVIVSFTSPKSVYKSGEAIPVTVTATDADFVYGDSLSAAILLDGGVTPVSSGNMTHTGSGNYTFTYNGPALAAGNHTFTARVTDSKGVSVTSSSLSIRVNRKPVVNMFPAGPFSAPATIVLEANASDPDGTITKVEFFQGAVKINDAVFDPGSGRYRFTWSNVDMGNYSVTAAATDNDAETAASSPISVVVNAPAPLVSAVGVGGVAENSAVINWTVRYAQKATVRYTKDPTLPVANWSIWPEKDMGAVTNGAPRTDSVTLTGLSPNQLYVFKIDFTGPGGATEARNDAVQRFTTGSDVTKPTIPGTLSTLDVRYNQITYKWGISTDLGGVTRYELQVSKDGFSSLTYTAMDTDGDLTHVAAGLTPNTAYQARVRAFDAAGNFSDFGNVVNTTTPDLPPPTFKQWLTVTQTAVGVEWEGATESYEAELTDGAGFTNVQSLPGATKTFNWAAPAFPITHNTQYTFRVRGQKEGVWSVWSTPVSIRTGVYPVQPLNAVVAGTKITFAWRDSQNTKLPVSYRVEAAEAMDFSGTLISQPATAVAGQTDYSVDMPNLTPTTRYWARVVALNADDARSAAASFNGGSSLDTPAALPSNVLVTNVLDSGFRLTWVHAPNPAATKYTLELAVAEGPGLPFDPAKALAAQRVADFNGTQRDFTGLVPNGFYKVRIKAQGISAAGDSAWVERDVTLQPQAVTNISFEPTVDSMKVSWTTANLPGTKYFVEIFDVDPTGGASAAGSQEVTGAQATFNALDLNTAYWFMITSLRNGSGTDKTTAPVRRFTLANSPAMVDSSDPSKSFGVVTDASVEVKWAANGNPAATLYQVEWAQTASGPWQTGPAPAAGVQRTVTGVPANAQVWFRVKALNGDNVATAAVNLGSITTQVRSAKDIVVTALSDARMRVDWDINGNAVGTTYKVENLKNGLAYTISNVEIAGGKARFEEQGLSPNTEHSYRVSAINGVGTPAPVDPSAISGSVWTLAQLQNAPQADTDGETTLEIRMFPGTNPLTGPNAVTFAFRINYDSRAGGSGPLVGRFLNPTGTARSDGKLEHIPSLTGSTSQEAVWGTHAQWTGGSGNALILSGLPPNVEFSVEIFARNNDKNLSGPLSSNPAITGSGTPVIRWGPLTGEDSQTQAVWLNTFLATFTATNSFHYNYVLNTANMASVLDSHPGWNGLIDPGAPDHLGRAAEPNSNISVDPLKGFIVPGDGEYYLHVLGTSFKTGGTHGNPKRGVSFHFFVDRTLPVVTAIRARATSDPLSTPYESGEVMPGRNPYLSWTAIDSGALPSGIVKYLVKLSGGSIGPGVETSLPDTQTFYQHFPESSSSALADGVYSFTVKALDKAGNFSLVKTFSFAVSDTVDRPQVDKVAFTRNPVTVEDSDWTVGVAMNPAIKVTFSRKMNTSLMAGGSPPGLLLNAVRNNAGQRINETVPVTFSFGLDPSNSKTVATLTPSQPLKPGYRYEVISTLNALGDNNRALFSNKGPVYRKFFNTAMDPAQDNVMTTDDDVLETRVNLPAGVWGTQWVGLAINPRPDVRPLPIGSGVAGTSLIGTIEQANGAVRRQTGGFGRPIALREFKFFDQDGNPVSGAFSRGVEVSIQYDENMLNADLAPGEPKARESALTLYRLDEKTGVWVKVPGSSVDTVANRVTATVRHFSVYAILGAPAMDLAGAYAFPVPFKPSRGDREITFKDLSSQATINIYTVSGEVVKELKETDGDGELKWDVTNAKGEPLASDVYMYMIENDQQKKIGKIMVVR